MMRRIVHNNNLNSKKFEDEVNPKKNAQSVDTSYRRSKRLKTDSLENVKELTVGLQKVSYVIEMETKILLN